ncbi:MAG: photosynthetic complex putative assembly protein PuhB [Pseudomonadota bacterium]
MQHSDDFKFEPIPGLPEQLPAGEHILWQGKPDSLRLARDAWNLNWILGYFAVLAVWRVIVSSQMVPFTEALLHGVPFVIAGAVAGLILYGMAYVQAQSTIYTLTNKRVVMRVGATLTLALNLPYVQIANAAVTTTRNGTGTIAFELMDEGHVSFLMIWPHTRPWHLRQVQPAFRSIPRAARVAEIFAEAAETRLAEPQVARVTAQGDPIAAE